LGVRRPHGQEWAPIQYLAIANEPDWPHEQPGCFLSPEANAELFKTSPIPGKDGNSTTRCTNPKLVGPNTLSAPDAAKRYARDDTQGSNQLAAIASHDYDMRGDR
jgi:O-glycosyl hydrolase